MQICLDNLYLQNFNHENPGSTLNREMYTLQKFLGIWYKLLLVYSCSNTYLHMYICDLNLENQSNCHIWYIFQDTPISNIENHCGFLVLDCRFVV